MNIDKVNATLGRALVQIQESEATDLREAFLADGEETDPVREYVEAIADEIVSANEGADFDAVCEAIADVAAGLAEANPAQITTAEEMDAWATKVGLADAIVARLSA